MPHKIRLLAVIAVFSQRRVRLRTTSYSSSPPAFTHFPVDGINADGHVSMKSEAEPIGSAAVGSCHGAQAHPTLAELSRVAKLQSNTEMR